MSLPGARWVRETVWKTVAVRLYYSANGEPVMPSLVGQGESCRHIEHFVDLQLYIIVKKPK